MQVSNSTVRRIIVLHRVLNQSRNVQLNVVNGSRNVRSYSSDTVVKIGDVSKPVQPSRNPQYVPLKYIVGELSQDSLKNLRWMLQKDVLGQDMFLIGRPGPLRRQLAMQYLELTGRELEYVSLSRDTTEADLKQRREIQAGTAKYFDQSAVRAAVEGRILVLEGIEKAERNVLPVLNNLLENREMHLEDGRFLIPASRYDKLLKEHSKEELDKWQLVRVSEDFRVIALGIPVPRYLGNPLDPPLRSRFQARDIHGQSFKDQLSSLRVLAPSVNPAEVSQLLSCSHALVSQESAALGLPDFPIDNLPYAAKLMEAFPSSSPFDAFYRLYPYNCFLGREGIQAVEDILKTFQLLPSDSRRKELKNGFVQNVIPLASQEFIADVALSYQGEESKCQVPCGNGQRLAPSDFVPTQYQDTLITEMLQSHLRHDLCIIGPKGCGKSVTVERLASMLNYQIEPIVLYQDMTSRDLIQQRTTLPNGDTVWKQSALVTAALEGKIAVLDGIHRIHPSTLAVIHRLVHDRELQLHDGQRLVRHDRYDQYRSLHNLTDQQLQESGIRRIHPSFRIVALAEPSSRGGSAGQWLSTELLSLFLFHEMRPLALQEERHIINTLYGKCSKEMENILNLVHKLRASEDPTLLSLAGSLSTRQLLRIARRMASYPTDSPADLVRRACLSRFLPSLANKALETTMLDAGIKESSASTHPDAPKCQVTSDTVTIGRTSVPRYQTDAKTKVPDILFFDIPQHVSALEWLLQDFILGEHLLLVGNQGVGKNKLADRLLQLLNRPREYIQLHRDTTVQTLTLQPTVRSGVVVYEDSPLVRAVKNGYVLIVDEADKAPTHVTCILKTLVESGEMILSDGRHIVPHADYRALSKSPVIVPVHPDFRMIVLANRPGFPFLGNDFFGALGDLFSCHSVDNPSLESEVALLKQYGPDVPDKIISRLVKAFGELRHLADQGLVQYPYSTREVVNIVKHLQEFQNESLAGSVGNVFDFDRYTPEIQELLGKTLHKHGIPLGANPNNIGLAKEFQLPLPHLVGEWTISHSSLETTHLLVQQRDLKPKPAIKLNTSVLPVDRVEARGMMFTEMQSYWTIPVPEGGIVASLAVTKDEENNQLNDLIHILATNPVSLFTMKLSGDTVTQVNLQRLFNPVYGTKPYFNIAPLAGEGKGSLLIHEEMNNCLILVNPVTGLGTQIPLVSTLESVTGNLARTFGAQSNTWRMAVDKSGRSNQLVLFEVGGSNIEIVDMDSLSAYHITLPLVLKSVHVVSHEKILIEDIENRKYVISKKDVTDVCPSILLPISETFENAKLGSLSSCGCNGMEYDTLSQALGQKITAPNRILCTEQSYATIAVGFPDLDRSSNEVYTWPRTERSTRTLGQTVVIEESGQVIRPLSSSQVPQDISSEVTPQKGTIGFLEVTDIINRRLRYIPLPAPRAVSPVAAWMFSNRELPVFVAPTSNSGLVSVDAGGCVRLWETELLNLHKSMEEWRKMIGTDKNYLQLTVEKASGKDVSSPKHGKVDEKNEPHVGGNTWAGGTGGRDTAGLGGKGGPYRLDAGHKVHQVTQEEKDAVPEEVKRAAREMGQKAFKQRLKDIQMSEYDAQVYEQFSSAVSKQVQALRVILGNLQAKSKERQWMRHQTSGELDDLKLIESLTGEKTIYRRRAEKEPELGTPQTKPKRLKLVIDVSGSMYRFNGYDGRLDREMEAVVMVMEAFHGHELRIQYDVMGHSGEDHNITFVEGKHPPQDNKQRLDIIKTMHAHAQFCMSGDHTLAATQLAIQSLSKEDCDEAIVVVLSDANLERYGIPPEHFAKILTSDIKVNAYSIFIGSLGDQAERLINKLPAGRAFVCLDLKNIPQILQQIFAASVLNTR